MYEFSIIIPTYNESETIISLLEEIASSLPNKSYELIVVDDNSPDGTAKKIKEYASKSRLSNILCIQRTWQKGLSSAVVEGIAISNSPLLIIMDGDGQHDPKNINDFLENQKSGDFDLIIGSRFLETNKTDSLSEARSGLSKTGIKITQRFIGNKFTDPLTGFFLVKKSSLSGLERKIYKDGFKILFDILMLGKNLKSKEVQINFRNRAKGDSKLNFSTLAHLLGQIVENISRQMVPSTFFVFGVIGSLGVLVHFSVLYSLLAFNFGYIFSNFIGSISGLTSNYLLNNFLTFHNLHNTLSKKIVGFTKYAIFNSLSLMANTGIASVLYLDSFSIAFSTIIGITAGLLLNYFLSKNIVFRS